MLVGKRTRKTEAAEAGPDEDQATEPETIRADLDAAGEQLRADAARLRAGAARLHAEDQDDDDVTRTEIARLAAGRDARHRDRARDAAAAEYEAGTIEEQAGYVAEADRHRVAREEDLERARVLTAEREDLTARIEGLESRLGHLDAERQDVGRQLAAATETADVDLGASLRPRAEQLSAAIASLTGQRDGLRVRLEVIGTGEERGELYEALSAAAGHAAEHQRMLYRAYPDSPAARHAAEWDERLAIFRANIGRIIEESKAKPVQQRTIVGR